MRRRGRPSIRPHGVLDAVLNNPGITAGQLRGELGGDATPRQIDDVLCAMSSLGVIGGIGSGAARRYYVHGMDEYGWGVGIALDSIIHAADRIRKAAAKKGCTADAWARVGKELEAITDAIGRVRLSTGGKRDGGGKRAATPGGSGMDEIRGHSKYRFGEIPARIRAAERINRGLGASEARIRRNVRALTRLGKTPAAKTKAASRPLWNAIIAERREMDAAAGELDDCADSLHTILHSGRPAVFGEVLREIHGGKGVVPVLGSAVDEVVGNDTTDYELDENEEYSAYYDDWGTDKSSLLRLQAYRALQSVRDEMSPVPEKTLVAGLVGTGRFTRGDAEAMIRDEILAGRLARTDAGLLVLSYGS